MSMLSDYLNARLPEGWTKPRLVMALDGQLDRATVYKYLAGSHPQNPSDSVLQAFAAVLPGATMVELRAAANQPVGVEEPWVPPAEANRLTLAQRKALEAFIKATVASNDATAAVPAPAALPALVPDRRPAPEPARLELDLAEQVEMQRYIDQLRSSGRIDLAERVAASLVISSASDTASRSSKH